MAYRAAQRTASGHTGLGAPSATHLCTRTPTAIRPVRIHRACASLRTRAADEKREIGCSELYSMVSAIEQQTDTQPASTAPQAQAATPSASTAGPAQPSASSSAPGTSQQPGKAAPQQPGGAAYYKGLLASDLKQDNGASSADMLKRSLGLAGFVSGLLVALVVAFLASNGLLG